MIFGGTLATATETYKADIGMKDGRIATLGTGLEGRETIDATGKLVLPGGIEAHCHIAQESATGGMTADDYRTGSISARPSAAIPASSPSPPSIAAWA
jgi:dihydropyrimidinase